jgi:methyl-accepting chemotaxis protein
MVTADAAGQIAAIHTSSAIVEFNMDGTIITANSKFLDFMGYTLEEVQGKHQRMFVANSETPEYATMWTNLNQGEFKSAEFKGIAKDGSEVFIQATYNPILDLNGRPYKVVQVSSLC